MTHAKDICHQNPPCYRIKPIEERCPACRRGEHMQGVDRPAVCVGGPWDGHVLHTTKNRVTVCVTDDGEVIWPSKAHKGTPYTRRQYHRWYLGDTDVSVFIYGLLGRRDGFKALHDWYAYG